MRAPALPLCAIVLGAAPALAAPLPPELPHFELRPAYTRRPGTATCPDEHGLTDIFTGEFGYDPFKAGAAPHVEIAASVRGAELRADIKLVDGAGETLWSGNIQSPTTCGDLMRSVALTVRIVAFRFRDKLLPPAPPPPLLPMPPLLPRPVLLPLLPPPGEPVGLVGLVPPLALDAASRPVVWLGAGVMVSGWITPSPTAGPSVFASVRWSIFSVDWEAHPAWSIVSAQERGAAFRSFFFSTSIAPCAHGRFFYACAVLDLGKLSFSADDPKVKVTTTNPLVFAMGVRPGFAWDVTHRFSLRAFADLSGVITTTTLTVDSQEAWRNLPFFVSLGVLAMTPWQ